MLFLPKVKKDNPGLTVTKKVKSVVTSLLAAVAVAVSGAAYANNTEVSELTEVNVPAEILNVEQNAPLLVIQHDHRQNGPAYHYSHSSHSSHYSHSSHSSHYSHYSSRY